MSDRHHALVPVHSPEPDFALRDTLRGAAVLLVAASMIGVTLYGITRPLPEAQMASAPAAAPAPSTTGQGSQAAPTQGDAQQKQPAAPQQAQGNQQGNQPKQQQGAQGQQQGQGRQAQPQQGQPQQGQASQASQNSGAQSGQGSRATTGQGAPLSGDAATGSTSGPGTKPAPQLQRAPTAQGGTPQNPPANQANPPAGQNAR